MPKNRLPKSGPFRRWLADADVLAVAAFVGVTRQAVYHWRDKGQPPARRNYTAIRAVAHRQGVVLALSDLIP